MEVTVDCELQSTYFESYPGVAWWMQHILLYTFRIIIIVVNSIAGNQDKTLHIHLPLNVLFHSGDK